MCPDCYWDSGHEASQETEGLFLYFKLNNYKICPDWYRYSGTKPLKKLRGFFYTSN